MIEPVADHIAECPFGLKLRLKLQIGVLRIAGERESERFKDFLGKDLMAEAAGIR